MFSQKKKVSIFQSSLSYAVGFQQTDKPFLLKRNTPREATCRNSVLIRGFWGLFLILNRLTCNSAPLTQQKKTCKFILR